MRRFLNIKIFLCFLIVGTILLSSLLFFKPVFAQNNYVLIVGVPGYGTGAGSINLNNYISAVIKVGVILAAMLAVIKIIIAGFMYVTAGGSTGKTEQAKQMIWDALIGVFIAAGFYLILMAINPEIINHPLRIDPVPYPSFLLDI